MSFERRLVLSEAAAGLSAWQLFLSISDGSESRVQEPSGEFVEAVYFSLFTSSVYNYCKGINMHRGH